MRLLLAFFVVLSNATTSAAADGAPAPDHRDDVRRIGSRRELMVDAYLIDHMDNLSFQMHRPEAQEVSLTCDKPWEGNTSAYYSLFADGDRFRVYYRGSHFKEETEKEGHPEVTCYAESTDGVHWTKPELGLFDFNGSKANNIVWVATDTHNFTPFKDSNPDCAPDARYKALGGSAIRWGGEGLRTYKSPDGIHWSPLREEAVITTGDFDSQNLAFWSDQEECYRAYTRKFHDGVRDIMVSRSTDFINWSEPVYLDYGDAPTEHLYTNAIQPYFRAPHLLVGFPTRFQPANEQVEPVLMTSRDSLHFKRWAEPLIPITAPKDRDGNRSNYLAHGLLQASGQEREISVYATEAYYTGPGSRLRRFTFRTDGFVSLRAGNEAGELVTRPLVFEGSNLELNYAVQPGGSVRVEVLNDEGEPIDGLVLKDCKPLEGDSLDQRVSWSDERALAKLAGTEVRLRIVLQDADLYALQFTE